LCNELNQSNQTCIHKHDNQGCCPYQRVQGGYSNKHPGCLDGNQTHALKAHGMGPDV
jgi:hypothetical protein